MIRNMSAMSCARLVIVWKEAHTSILVHEWTGSWTPPFHIINVLETLYQLFRNTFATGGTT
jgi:hypothetical protein